MTFLIMLLTDFFQWRKFIEAFLFAARLLPVFQIIHNEDIK